ACAAVSRSVFAGAGSALAAYNGLAGTEVARDYRGKRDRPPVPAHGARRMRAADRMAVRRCVRAENPVHSSDQRVCSPGRPAVMITDHVPAVRLPPDHAGDLMAATVPARGSVADRRDLDPAPPGRRPATAAATPPEPELGGPGPARDPAGRDTESAAPGAAAAGHPGHDPALAPRHRPPPLGRPGHLAKGRHPADRAAHRRA